jgi:hypothetical protein
MKEALLKLAALFSYCGGPLFIGELLKPRLDAKLGFLITFLPIALMLIGALFLSDMRDRWSSAAVWVGRLGVCIAMGMHLYALWRFANGTRVSEQSLYYLGIVVGVAWNIAYLRAARRWALAGQPSEDRS